jgi:hypothetical protein
MDRPDPGTLCSRRGLDGSLGRKSRNEGRNKGRNESKRKEQKGEAKGRGERASASCTRHVPEPRERLFQ